MGYFSWIRLYYVCKPSRLSSPAGSHLDIYIYIYNIWMDLNGYMGMVFMDSAILCLQTLSTQFASRCAFNPRYLQMPVGVVDYYSFPGGGAVAIISVVVSVVDQRGASLPVSAYTSYSSPCGSNSQYYQTYLTRLLYILWF